MDTEVSPEHPESWRGRILEESFPEDIDGDAWMRGDRTEYPTGSHTYGNDYSPEIRRECGGKPVEKSKLRLSEGKVFVDREGVLERKFGLVTWLFCLYGGNRRGKNHPLCEMAAAPGFRSSGA